MEYSWSFILPFLVIIHTVSSSVVVEEYACFSQLFQIKCQEEELIVFEHARYGRNDTHLAAQCGVPFTRRCDIDVNFSLNRVCAGKQTCNIAVNTALFGDPCGYEEFLKVKYRCVPVSTIAMSCESSRAPQHFDHGYLASPNYPAKYYMDAECFWKLSVQKRQTIKLTIFDFELDVKKGGQCTDYLEVYAGEKTYFMDCGILGRSELEVDASDVVLRFKTSAHSLTQRGFFIYFEAVGPGCPDIVDFATRKIVYFIEEDILYANATCQEGFIFRGTDNAHFQQIRCTGAFWSTQVGECVEIPPSTTPVITEVTTQRKKSSTEALHKSSSIVGIALGVVSAVLLITLMLLCALYVTRRKRSIEKRKADRARVFMNNLQEGENTLSKQDKRKPNNKDTYSKGDTMCDSSAGHNLLPPYQEEEYYMDTVDGYRQFPSCDTTPMPPKTPEKCAAGYGFVPPMNSTPRKPSKYGLARSRDSTLNPTYERARPTRNQQRRSKSGQFDPPARNRSFVYSQVPPTLYATVPRGVCTRSAPDLTELGGGVTSPPQSPTTGVPQSPEGAAPSLPPPPPPRALTTQRSATLGHPKQKSKRGSQSRV